MASNHISIGTDIEEISRIKSSINASCNFLNKCFLESEIDYCLSKHSPEKHFATRFCAKEAFAKALGKPCRWHDVEILNNDIGKPFINLYGKLEKELKDYKIDLSMSHSREYATAVVIIVK